MNKEQLFEIFTEMFPDWAKKAITYKKIGSRTLAIKFEESVDDQKATEISRVFLYIDPSNWQFGTKIWRKRPDYYMKKKKDTAKEFDLELMTGNKKEEKEDEE